MDWRNRAKKKRTSALNANLPEELASNLSSYCADTGLTKSQVLRSALNQFLAIKNEEQSFKNQYPSRRIKTNVVVEAVQSEEEPAQMASVLIY